MGLLDGLNHLLNFAAPAMWLAVGLAVLSRIGLCRGGGAWSLRAQIALGGLVCLCALAAGLWFFGRDGKMATYAVMVLSGASVQWGMNRAWKP